MKRRTTRRRVIMIFADIDALFDAFTRGGFQSGLPFFRQFDLPCHLPCRMS